MIFLSEDRSRRRARELTTISLIILALPTCAEAGDTGPFGRWSGAYIGGQIGGVWGDLENSDARTTWGGHAGYGLQIDNFVIGIEGDATWGGTRSSTLVSPLIYWDSHTNWTSSIRGRLGVAIGDLHFYATAGAAFINQTSTINNLGQSLQTNTHSTPGLVLGGGLEYRVLPGISARLEALHYDYSLSSQAWASEPLKLAPPIHWQNLSTQDTVVRAGISWRFN